MEAHTYVWVPLWILGLSALQLTPRTWELNLSLLANLFLFCGDSGSIGNDCLLDISQAVGSPCAL